MQELKMNVPQLPSLFGREQEQLQVESQYSNLPFMNSPGVNDAIPSPLSTFPIKPVAPFKQDWTSVLDYESMLLESSRTYSARSNASHRDPENRCLARRSRLLARSWDVHPRERPRRSRKALVHGRKFSRIHHQSSQTHCDTAGPTAFRVSMCDDVYVTLAEHEQDDLQNLLLII
eukprot:TRINITY_DN18734_c0_g1_i5.p1 TRINITY_DN18734_c0_g1~~TRINITY_DN18734_c0_g1_i5.p1  ORF type:complete len:175 (+),score=10.38 TRINITY_DN18734_c0_g1_i5:487-1011(+)